MTPLQTYLSDTDKLFEEKFCLGEDNNLGKNIGINEETGNGMVEECSLEELKSFLHERQIGLVEVMKEKVNEIRYKNHNPEKDCDCETCRICSQILKNLELKDIKIKQGSDQR